MATVYLARQTDLDRFVALKELSAVHASDPEFARRFLRESHLAASLSHPNIVTVHEYFEHGGTPFIAMEYLDHGTLRSYVGWLSLAQIVGVIEGILAGLTHAETKGIVHRDLKPENVMMTEEGRIKITDFGIAKATQAVATGFLTATGTTIGTPAYMAPEQAMAQDIGPWTDLYSLGVMAYEMLVGRLPFPESEAPLVLLMRHVNESVPPPRSIKPDLDEELAGWLERMLEKAPDNRIRSAAAAWDQLEESVIRIFGARWRREARLPEAAAVDNMRPLTLAPFQDVKPTDGPRTGASEAFQSFVWGKKAPATSAAEAEAPMIGATEAEMPPPPEATPNLVTRDRQEPNVPAAPPLEPAAPPPEVAPEPEDWGATVAPSSVPKLPRAEPAPRPVSSETTAAAERGRNAAAIAAIAAVLVGTVAGFAIAPSSKHRSVPQGLPNSASSAAVGLDFPAGWHRLSEVPRIAGMKLSEPVAVENARGDAQLVAGMVDATGPTLLPASFVYGLASPPRPVAVKLAGGAAYRYILPSGAGPAAQTMTVYTIPTSSGVATLACLGAVADTSACGAIASTLRLQNARAFALGPSAAYAKSLVETIGRLNSARTAASADLAKARTAAAQASAARALSGAYGEAASTMRGLKVSPADRDAHDDIVAALSKTSGGYRALATAAMRNDHKAYGKAVDAVQRRESRAGTAIAALKDLGYAPT
jgi:hypothetical protein